MAFHSGMLSVFCWDLTFPIWRVLLPESCLPSPVSALLSAPMSLPCPSLVKRGHLPATSSVVSSFRRENRREGHQTPRSKLSLWNRCKHGNGRVSTFIYWTQSLIIRKCANYFLPQFWYLDEKCCILREFVLSRDGTTK